MNLRTALRTLLLASVLQALPDAGAQPAPPSLLARMNGWETLVMPGANMEPTLHLEEALLVDLNEHRTRPLRGGDIVAYDVPVNDRDARATGRPPVFVMRVVGIAGDRMAVAGGRAIRNGQPVPEPYAELSGLNAYTATSKEVVVPADHVYVLGDNRGNSNDSRFNGPIPLRSVRGVVKFAGRSAIQGPFRSVETPHPRSAAATSQAH